MVTVCEMFQMSVELMQNGWQYGVCDCHQNPGLCCKGWWCTPCLICDNGEVRLALSIIYQQLHPLAQAVGKDGCVWCLLSCCLPWAATSLFRSSTRELYGIEGSEGEDWLVGILCTPCTACQTAQEILERDKARQ